MKWIWIVIISLFLIHSSEAQRFQKSYYITISKDTIKAKFAVNENMLTVKTEGGEEEFVSAEELYGFYDPSNEEFIYSKPFHQTEKGPVFGFMKLLAGGRVNLYLRKLGTVDKSVSPLFLADQRGANVEEYYLEGEGKRIRKIRSNDDVVVYVEDDKEIVKKLKGESLNAKRLTKLIKEYNLRN